MSDGPIDVDALKVSDLSPDSVAGLGDSALGHALHRVLATDVSRLGPDAPETIAAHDSHV
jgi:FXSXX-COOH protein